MREILQHGVETLGLLTVICLLQMVGWELG